MMIQLKEGEFPAVNQHHQYAIVAITKHGVELARKLHAVFTHSDLYYMSKLERGDEQQKHIQLFSGCVRLLLPVLFR